MTDKYIRKQDASDAVIKHLQLDYECAWGAREAINALPSADVAPIVRCGRCKYWQDNDGDYGYCYAKDGQGFGHAWDKNDFCSYGERKEA